MPEKYHGLTLREISVRRGRGHEGGKKRKGGNADRKVADCGDREATARCAVDGGTRGGWRGSETGKKEPRLKRHRR